MKEPSLNGHSLARIQIPVRTGTDRRAVLIVRGAGCSGGRVKDGKTAERIPVRIGISDGGWVAVEGELSERDPVVVRGAETLYYGDAVTIVGNRSV